MWAIKNHTAYAAERNWTRDKRGVHQWIVAVRATFAIAPNGELSLADEQPPPVLVPEYHGEPGASSLRYDSDLLRAKPCTDVIMDACAHAPRGKKVRRVEVSMRVGAIDKTIVVSGDRLYHKRVLRGIRPGKPAAFDARPIRYEWSYGGTDTADRDPRKHRLDERNPIGSGFAVKPAHLIDKPVPAIEYPKGDIAERGPAGFGPIDAAWSPRRELAGTYDAAWEKNKKPLLADDYDDLYASCAPRDQRVLRYLRGGEPVELVNLTSDGMLRFVLPRVYLTFSTRFGSQREEHRGKLASVLLQPERMRLSLVWQAVLVVAAKRAEYLDHTTIREKPYLT
jgi:hypothetical protein